MADRVAPQLRGSLGGLERADLLELEGAHDAVAVGGVDGLRRPRRPLGQERVQGVRAATLELLVPALAHAGRRRWTQREVGEGGAQVEPGAADHDRRGALGQQRIDLRVGELGVLGDAEAVVDGNEGDEAVLELGPLGGAGHAGEGLEAGVDLQGVGGDGHRPLAAGPQAARERHRDLGLSHRGRPEERDDPHRHRLSIVSGMPIRIGAALSHSRDARTAAIDAAQEAAAGLDGRRADVAVVFACGDHLAAPEALLEGVHEALRPGSLVGCGASGVIATRRGDRDRDGGHRVGGGAR